MLEDAGPLVGTLRQLGFTPEEFPLNGSLMRLNTAQQIFRLARWFKRNQVELVHVHDFYSTMLVVPAAKLAGAKVIVGRLDLAHWHGPARRAVHAQFSPHGGPRGGQRGGHPPHAGAGRVAWRPRSVSVIHNGLDLPRFDARVREGL